MDEPDQYQQNGKPTGNPTQRAMKVLDLIAEGVNYVKARDDMHVGHSTIRDVRQVLKKRPDLAEAMRSGEVTAPVALAGMGVTRKRNTNRNRQGIQYGRGDEWFDASQPMIRYLEGWQDRDFAFKHLNYKQAEKRLDQIAHIERLLGLAKADLEARAVRAQTALSRHYGRERTDGPVER